MCTNQHLFVKNAIHANIYNFNYFIHFNQTLHLCDKKVFVKNIFGYKSITSTPCLSLSFSAPYPPPCLLGRQYILKDKQNRKETTSFPSCCFYQNILSTTQALWSFPSSPFWLLINHNLILSAVTVLPTNHRLYALVFPGMQGSRRAQRPR